MLNCFAELFENRLSSRFVEYRFVGLTWFGSGFRWWWWPQAGLWRLRNVKFRWSRHRDTTGATGFTNEDLKRSCDNQVTSALVLWYVQTFLNPKVLRAKKGMYNKGFIVSDLLDTIYISYSCNRCKIVCQTSGLKMDNQPVKEALKRSKRQHGATIKLILVNQNLPNKNMIINISYWHWVLCLPW